MKKHIVQSGECLASIAEDYDFFSWKTIYEAPENKDLRKQRPNPNVLYPGDEVIIPEKEIKEESRPAEKKHRFKAHRPKWLFRLEMKDEQHRGLEDVAYELRLPGGPPIKKKTGKGGLIEAPIPAGAKSGKLLFLGEEIQLNFGGLDPITRLKGVQQRLNNLGFKAGPVDGIVGPKTRRAVAAFQSTQKELKKTGEIDDATLKRLLEVHDNDKKPAAREEEMKSQPVDSESGGSSEKPGPGGLDHHLDEGKPDSEQKLIYFAIYYLNEKTDKDKAFERAATTWKREMEGKGVRPSFDEILVIGVKTETDFKNAWEKVRQKADDIGGAVKEGHVFSHSSTHLAVVSEFRGDKSWGLEFVSSKTDDGTIEKEDLKKLAGLNWHPEGLLVLHGCNTGRTNFGWRPAELFSATQGVRTLGQQGWAYFSKERDKYVEIDSQTQDIYLWAYYRGKNALWYPAKAARSDEAIPAYEAELSSEDMARREEEDRKEFEEVLRKSQNPKAQWQF